MYCCRKALLVSWSSNGLLTKLICHAQIIAMQHDVANSGPFCVGMNLQHGSVIAAWLLEWLLDNVIRYSIFGVRNTFTGVLIVLGC